MYSLKSVLRSYEKTCSCPPLVNTPFALLVTLVFAINLRDFSGSQAPARVDSPRKYLVFSRRVLYLNTFLSSAIYLPCSRLTLAQRCLTNVLQSANVLHMPSIQIALALHQPCRLFRHRRLLQCTSVITITPNLFLHKQKRHQLMLIPFITHYYVIMFLLWCQSAISPQIKH